MRLLALAVVFSSSVVLAQNALVPGVVEVDRPTLAAVGVRWLVSGDANRNATGTVRYRVMGTVNWRSGPPLHRVHPQNVTAITVPEQLSGQVRSHLAPATTPAGLSARGFLSSGDASEEQVSITADVGSPSAVRTPLGEPWCHLTEAMLTERKESCEQEASP